MSTRETRWLFFHLGVGQALWDFMLVSTVRSGMNLVFARIPSAVNLVACLSAARSRRSKPQSQPRAPSIHLGAS